MLTRLGESAFPRTGSQAERFIPGLTIREYIATQVLAGMFASPKAPEAGDHVREWFLPAMVDGAVMAADALIEKLYQKK